MSQSRSNCFWLVALNVVHCFCQVLTLWLSPFWDEESTRLRYAAFLQAMAKSIAAATWNAECTNNLFIYCLERDTGLCTVSSTLAQTVKQQTGTWDPSPPVTAGKEAGVNPRGAPSGQRDTMKRAATAEAGSGLQQLQLEEDTAPGRTYSNRI